jgi:DNA-binding NarL/FixJ family response regulator
MTDPESTSEPIPAGPAALLLSHDLIFTSKITGTARELGHRVMVAGNDPLARSMLEQWRPRVVFVDLANDRFSAPEVIVAYRTIVPDSRFIAFGSHVDTKLLSTARDAGCDPVMPRSKFTAELPDLIRQYLGDGR